MDLDLNVRLEEEDEDVNIILVEELRRMDLDLNVRLEEEEEEDVNVILEEETVAQLEQIPEEETVAQRQHIDMPEKDKFAAYITLKALSKHRPVEKADKELVAQLLKVCLRTIEKIWKQALDMEKQEQEIDFSNKRKGNCGRKRKDLHLSERVPQIELNKRGTLRALARSLESPAKYNSKYRDKGTMELKTINVTRDVMREYLCEKVVPAIAELWPEDGPEGPIFIQQDNCRTHVLPDDPAFIAAVNATGMDIQLTYQPPNSPDMNVLNLLKKLIESD
jgi:hypothetical protein